jgi:hypothetical protein
MTAVRERGYTFTLPPHDACHAHNMRDVRPRATNPMEEGTTHE